MQGREPGAALEVAVRQGRALGAREDHALIAGLGMLKDVLTQAGMIDSVMTTMRLPAARCRPPRRFIVPLPAAASRSLPAVASHEIGFAAPRPSAHSPGIGACRGRRDQSRIRPGGSPGRVSRV
jgi:hypothetical protein